MSARKALVVGAGIGGLSAAIALRCRGWDVTVAENKAENKTVGVGINHPANALRALRALGVYDEVLAKGNVYRGIRRYTQGGRLIAVWEPENPPDVPFQVSMTRADLHDILTAAAVTAGARIELGRTWTRADQLAADVTVEFDDGEAATYDLVVGADGVRSLLRRHLFGDAHEPVYTGYVCWRMPARRPADLTQGVYFNGNRVKATLINLNAEAMYLLVVQKAEIGRHRDAAQLASELAALIEPFPGLIADIRKTIGPHSDIHRAPLEEVTLPAPWHRGRIVVIGDAAHALTPHLAQGAAMAIEDAIVLADELGTAADIDKALLRFADRRKPRVTFVQEQAHAILMNEMESDAEKKAAFAAALGERQAQITRVLASPA